MPAAPRASPIRRGTGDRDRTPVTLYRATAAGKTSVKTARGKTLEPSAGLDLAERLRGFQRTLRVRIERRDALLDMVRTVNATHEPSRIADALVDRAQSWMPAPCWAVVLSDLSG